MHFMSINLASIDASNEVDGWHACKFLICIVYLFQYVSIMNSDLMGQAIIEFEYM